ncbi:hypothetical protein SUDANB176_03910 [Streptomyces sp. enrichment culture]
MPEITESHLGAARSVRVRYRSLGRHKAFRTLPDDLPL